MELLGPFLLIFQLAILLSPIIFSTTNPTNAEALDRKGGDGVKSLRVRRQNLHLPDELHLPEKAYAFYILWRLLSDAYDDTKTITTSKMPGSNETTAMPSSPNDPSSPASRDLQLVEQSTHQHSQITEQKILDSTAFKITSITVMEPSLDIKQEQSTRSIGMTSTNDSTTLVSFSLDPLSQETTQLGDSQLDEQSTHFFQKIPEPSEVTKEYIPDSTAFTIKIPFKTAKEPSSTAILEHIDTTDFTAVTSFPADLQSQESPKNTHSGSSRLQRSTQHFQSFRQTTTALLSIPDLTTTYRSEREAPLQTATDSHVTNNGILASTAVNDSQPPTSLPQMRKNEHPQITTVNTEVVKGISNPTRIAQTKESSTVRTEIRETWYNGKPDGLVMAMDQRFPEPTPTEQPIHNSTSPLMTAERRISQLNESTLESTPAEEPTNQHTKQNTINTAKSSFMQSFMTTNDSPVINKTSSPPLDMTEVHLVDDSKGQGDGLTLTDISLQVSTPSTTSYLSDPKTKSLNSTNKHPIPGTMMSHTSVLSADTQSQAPTNGLRSSQTIPVSREKLIVTFPPNPKPSEKHIYTTSVVRRGFLTSRSQQISSTKPSNLDLTETAEPRSNSNQGPTANTRPKESYSTLTEMDNPFVPMFGHKTSMATTRSHMSETKTASRNAHKPADTAIKNDMETRREFFGIFFTLGCLILLIMVILLLVVWGRCQAWRWMNDIWVAGPPFLQGTFHSVSQNSSPQIVIEMKKGNTKKAKQENRDVYESLALKQQEKDEDVSKDDARHNL